MTEQQLSYESFCERYDRQTRNWGHDNQKKIHDRKVLVLGGDLLAECTLGCLAGLGAGNILIMDNVGGGYGFLSENPAKRNVLGITRTLQRINPGIFVRGANSRFSASVLSYEGFVPDTIIDTTNDRWQKERILDYIIKRNKGCCFLSAYASGRKIAVSRYDIKKDNTNDILDETGIFGMNRHQGAIISGIGAGILCDEVRKAAFKLKSQDLPLDKRIIYNIDAWNRTSLKSEILLKRADLVQKKCLVAGAGSIGNYAALSLILSGIKNIDIIDFDNIENINLNRQILFYERIGDSKSLVLAERLNAIRDANCRPYNIKINSNSGHFFQKNRYDVMFGCFDNKNARFLLNKFAIDYGIPYIDGGTSESYGTVKVYIPGRTQCVSCKKNLQYQEETVRNSCATALPSVVMPNIVIGNAMVGEGLHILNGLRQDIGIVYNSYSHQRIFASKESKLEKACNCKSGIR